MAMILCLAFICSFVDYVPPQCEDMAMQEDFTDTGVGCVDDCLEIQDEAQTTVSTERN